MRTSCWRPYDRLARHRPGVGRGPARPITARWRSRSSCGAGTTTACRGWLDRYVRTAGRAARALATASDPADWRAAPRRRPARSATGPCSSTASSTPRRGATVLVRWWPRLLPGIAAGASHGLDPHLRMPCAPSSAPTTAPADSRELARALAVLGGPVARPHRDDPHGRPARSDAQHRAGASLPRADRSSADRSASGSAQLAELAPWSERGRPSLHAGARPTTDVPRAGSPRSRPRRRCAYLQLGRGLAGAARRTPPRRPTRVARPCCPSLPHRSCGNRASTPVWSLSRGDHQRVRGRPRPVPPAEIRRTSAVDVATVLGRARALTGTSTS